MNKLERYEELAAKYIPIIQKQADKITKITQEIEENIGTEPPLLLLNALEKEAKVITDNLEILEMKKLEEELFSDE